MESYTQTVKRIKEAGVIAALPGDLPLPSVLAIGDALLASPVFVVEVLMGPDADPLITDLRKRAGPNMVIGAGEVDKVAQLETAVAAGAQFISSSLFSRHILAGCMTVDIPYLPGVISVMAAQAAQVAGCEFIRLTTGGPDGPAYLRNMQTTLPDLDVIVGGDIIAANIGDYVRAGAAAVIVDEALFTGPDQPMTEIIRNARTLQNAWVTGCKRIGREV